MCGIIGYLGKNDAKKIILEGLKSLEYRGYDSAGMALKQGNEIHIIKSEGKISKLEEKLVSSSIVSSMGIGHTRWATHGKPNELNAHPHQSGKHTLIHNGIIENYIELKAMLVDKGFEFYTETDTEIAVKLLDHYSASESDYQQVLLKTANALHGSFALGIICTDYPDRLFALKKGSPMIVGWSPDDVLFASDIPALIKYTNQIYFLEDEELAELSADQVNFFNFSGEPVKKNPQVIQWTPSMVEKRGYRHFMLKEIHDQSASTADLLSARVLKDESEIEMSEITQEIEFSTIEKIHILACGTSYHTGLVGKYLIESLARIPVEVELASEFRYRIPIVKENTLIIPISQSGETADTLASLKLSHSMGVKALAICNVPHSSIARLSQATFYMLAGPEIGVAATKTFTSQMLSLLLIALGIASRQKNVNAALLKEKIDSLLHIPVLIDQTLLLEKQLQEVAHRYYEAANFLFIGRGIFYPIALEGALKLKEISYIHAEGYAAGELKHGPIALIDEHIPTVAICLKDENYSKMISNIEEIHSRSGQLIIVATQGDEQVKKFTKDVIYVPPAPMEILPILTIIPLQILSYYIATLKGTDVDQPRNLAKSVTVE